MRNKLPFMIIVIYLSLFLFLVSCGGKKAEWMGSIEEVEGIVVVKNPSEPMYGEGAFVLEEDLTIESKDREDEFIFHYTPNLVVDDEENIHVLDARAACIHVFGKNGEFIHSYGEKGQGPEEMDYPLDIRAAPHGELMVLDIYRARLNFFSQNGEHLRAFSTDQLVSMRRPVIDSRGYVITGTVIMGDDVKTTLKKYASDLSPVSTITTQAVETSVDPVVQEYFEVRRGTNLVWDVTCQDDIIWGKINKYEIFVHNPEGEPVRKIVREYEGNEITKKEQMELLKYFFGDNPIPDNFNGIKFPKTYPPFVRFTCDGEGRIIVQTYDKTQDGEKDYYDVFDAEGKYIARFSLKFRPQAWKNNKLYTMEEDEEGYQVVKRYKVTWNI
jgi:hypothetical protein